MMNNNLRKHYFTEPDCSIFDTMVSEYYKWVIEYNSMDGSIIFYYISDDFLERGITPMNIDSFTSLNEFFSKEMIVAEEKEAYLEQLSVPYILHETRTHGSFVRTMHINTSDGVKAESLRITPIKNSSARFLMCLTDISMILDRDWMTDDFSRSGFIAMAEKLLKLPDFKSGYSIIYFNIKGFKVINDLLGTQNGDMILFGTRANIIRELNPILIARLESDHFAIFIKTDNITNEKMDHICHQTYFHDSKQMSYVLRCGIYNITDPTKKVTYMLDQAALAEVSIASESTVPYAVCNDALSQNYINQRLFVSELDSALDKSEFTPYFQPIVDSHTGEIVSAEALVSWNHSAKGRLSAEQFIPIFEKEGLTSKIACFMINNVLDFNIKRLEKGLKCIPCSVNLSRIDFYDANLLDFITQRLSNQEHVSEMLKIEITESSYAFLEANALAFLDTIQRLNIDILLDDFGNGMSSLATLEQYDFNVLKLDIGFVKKIGKNPKTEAIIRHIINLAHSMGLKVVAEGVELDEQLEFLRSANCDMIQGFYFYSPMPEEEFSKLI